MMMLRSAVEAMGAVIFPSMALVIFIAVFAGVLLREWRRPKSNAQRMANLPNEDEVDGSR